MVEVGIEGDGGSGEGIDAGGQHPGRPGLAGGDGDQA
jgi:hypothetical protein